MMDALAPVALNCGVVTLRPWWRGDEERLVQIADDPKIAAYMADVFPSPYTALDAATWIAQNEAADPKTHCAILLDSQIVGGVGYMVQSGERRIVAQLGYWLAVPYWGLGIATAACRAMTAYAFDHHELRRIEAAVYVPNVASQRVLEKCGYEREGRVRNAVIKNGDVLDAYLYAIVR